MGPIAWYLSYNWTWFSYSLLSRVGSLQHHVSAVGVCWRWLHFPDTSVSIFFLSFMIINCFLFFFFMLLSSGCLTFLLCTYSNIFKYFVTENETIFWQMKGCCWEISERTCMSCSKYHTEVFVFYYVFYCKHWGVL